MVWALQPLLRVVGVSWGGRNFIRLLLLNISPSFLCENGEPVMTRANVLFYGYNLKGDAPEYLVGPTGAMFLGAAFNDLPLLPLDPPTPCAQAYIDTPGCGVRTYGDPADPGFDDLALKFSNIWGQSGYTTTSDNFIPGIRVRFTSYDPATCDIVGGYETSWRAICETYEMPPEMPTLNGSSYLNPETALVPENAELIYSEEIVFPAEVLAVDATTEAFYFYRDIEGRGRINKDNFDNIDPTHGLPTF